jgi:quinoprotein glucose dehydrogenase
VGTFPLFALKPFTVTLAFSAFATFSPADTDWPSFGGDPGGGRFSPLSQINTNNVGKLTVAWVYHTGDLKGDTPTECTPLIVDGTMYLVTSGWRIVALDPTNGVQKWSYDSHNDPSKCGHQKASRGLAYWSDRKNGGERRILYGTPDGRILSVDARTGQADTKFHPVDLRTEVGVKDKYVGVSAAPTVYKDLVYVGIANDEGEGSAPGNIMAFSVHTGKKVWNFNVIEAPNGQAGGPWNGYTLDQRRGILFAATGSESPDFDGSGRPGNDLYSDCVLALDAATGKLLWHFQTVHHDLWDHDNASAPTLCRVRRNGRQIDAVAEVTKTGLCFVFDRVTGKPLFDVKEVQAGPIDGGSPTQPEPVLPPPLSKTLFTTNDVTDLNSKAHDFVMRELDGLSYGRQYLPPTVHGTVVAPGYFGGAPWSGASFDPRTNRLFVNTNNLPCIVSNPANYRFLVDDRGYPGVKPPWGNLTAIDLDSGQFVWRKPLGEYRELTAEHIPPTGTLTFGGTIVTAGNLVFVGSTADSTFRAFDSRTGDLLFSQPLPASAYAAPATYSIKGKQYVVIAATGGGFGKVFGFDHGNRSDEFVCFALPNRK